MSIGAYPSYLRGCGWPQTHALTRASHQMSDMQRTDAVIIGAGFTGMSIARQLSRNNPSMDICLLDADTIGAGSSGRNSGFLLTHIFGKSDPAKAARLHQAYVAACAQLFSFSQLPTGPLAPVMKAAATELGRRNVQQMADFFEESHQPYHFIGGEQLQAYTGSSYYQQGLALPDSYLVNPVDLSISVANNLSDIIRFFPHNPVISIERQGENWQVKTQTGVFLTPQLFLANNSFAPALGIGKDRLITIFTYAAISAPLSPDQQAQLRINPGWGILPAHRLGTTFRTLPDGRLLVRGLYDYQKERRQNVLSYLSASLQKRFGNIADLPPLTDWWGGTTGLTANGAPLWGEVAEGLYCAAGCNGVGIVKGWLLGRELANLAQNRPHQSVPSLLGTAKWLPPEPFRKIGFLAATTYEKYLAGAER